MAWLGRRGAHFLEYEKFVVQAKGLPPGKDSPVIPNPRRPMIGPPDTNPDVEWMPNKFMHISFNFESRPAKTSELESIFNLALDWVRYAPNCWIVWTSSDAARWGQTAKAEGSQGRFDICL